MVGPVMCSYDPQSYTGGTYIRIDSIDSVSASIASEYVTSQYAYATGGASEAKQVKGDNLDKMRYPGPRGWRLAVRLTTPPRQKKKNTVTKPQRESHGPPRAV